jgi:hypothetical protein
MIENLIQQINNAIQLDGPHTKMFGLAQTMMRKRGNEMDVMPCLVDLEGEGKYIGIDDKFHLFSYHKVYSVTFANSKTGFGNNLDLIITHFCAMIVYLNRSKKKMLADDLMLLIQSRFPLIITAPPVKTIVVTLQNTILDGRRVAQEEYQDPNILIPEASMMAINYKIESTFKKGCFDTCK